MNQIYMEDKIYIDFNTTAFINGTLEEIGQQGKRRNTLTFKITDNLKNIRAKSSMVGYQVYDVNDNICIIATDTDIKVYSSAALEFLHRAPLGVQISNIDNIDLENTILSSLKDNKCSGFDELQLSRTRTSGLDLTGQTFGFEETRDMFKDSSISNLNLMDTKFINAKSARRMFYGFEANNINIGYMDLGKVTDASQMFLECFADKVIGLSLVKFGKLKTIAQMFFNSTIREIDIKNIDLSECTDMSGTFTAFRTRRLNFNYLDTRRVEKMVSLFEGAHIDELDLRKMRLDSLKDANMIFFDCKCKHIVMTQAQKEIFERLDNTHINDIDIDICN